MRKAFDQLLSNGRATTTKQKKPINEPIFLILTACSRAIRATVHKWLQQLPREKEALQKTRRQADYRKHLTKIKSKQTASLAFIPLSMLPVSQSATPCTPVPQAHRSNRWKTMILQIWIAAFSAKTTSRLMPTFRRGDEGCVRRHSQHERRIRNDEKSSATNDGPNTMDNHPELTKQNQESQNQQRTAVSGIHQAAPLNNGPALQLQKEATRECLARKRKMWYIYISLNSQYVVYVWSHYHY